MVERDVDDRKFIRRQRLRHLHRPPLPRVAPPEVVRPEEPALAQVLAQLRRLRRREIRAARLGHHHPRTLEEFFFGELQHEPHGISLAHRRDRDARQLRDAQREVLIRARIVDEPPGAIAIRRRVELDPAEAKPAVIAFLGGRLRIGDGSLCVLEIPESTEPLGGRECRDDDGKNEREGRGGTAHGRQ